MLACYLWVQNAVIFTYNGHEYKDWDLNQIKLQILYKRKTERTQVPRSSKIHL